MRLVKSPDDWVLVPVMYSTPLKSGIQPVVTGAAEVHGMRLMKTEKIRGAKRKNQWEGFGIME
jgi:hypothetical protein